MGGFKKVYRAGAKQFSYPTVFSRIIFASVLSDTDVSLANTVKQIRSDRIRFLFVDETNNARADGGFIYGRFPLAATRVVFSRA